MAKSLTKKELRAPDKFQTVGRVGATWVEDHLKSILAACLAVVFISLGWIGYGYYQASKETEAEKAIFPLQDLALQSLRTGENFDGSKLENYIEGLKANGGTKAAASSAMLTISALSAKENTQDMQKRVLLAAQFSPSSKEMIFGLWQLTKGQVFSKNGELAEAKEAYQEVIRSAAQKDFHPLALLQLGALAEKEGDQAGAKDFYRRVTTEFPDSEAKRTADKLLIHLDLSQQSAAQGS